MARACFPSVFQFPIWQTLFPVSALLLSRCILCLRYTAEKFSENPSMRALAKILRARASDHSCNFCEQFEQRPNFASTFKLDGTIRYPKYAWCLLLTSLSRMATRKCGILRKRGSPQLK